jgi:hypothetical protein
MAHFAQIDDNNTVIEVIVVDNDNAPGAFPDSEPIGQKYLADNGFVGRFLQTSYNNNFRGTYAGIGFLYDEELDVFIDPNNE